MTAWLADLVWTGGAFESGLAMVADERGAITRFSRGEEDLKAAEKLPGRAILPGLVNVHSHTFQRVIRGRTEHRTQASRDTFWTWRESMYHAANRMSPEALYRAARMAFLEMVLSGITAVGEFHYVDQNLDVARAILRAAKEVGLRITLLRTAYVRAGWRKDPNPGQARFLTPDVDRFLADTDALIAEGARVGVAPHSVRAVPIDYIRAVAEYARARGLPLHMHVSEQPAEVEASLGEYGRRPVELLHDHGILGERFTAVHAIHIAEEEARMLGGSTVCACPTSERNLGDGAVPADKLIEAGARICFGSDSNVQIDILEDARELEYHLRMNKLERVVLETRQLFQSATESGARSLGSPGGLLEVGRPADFFTIDLNDCSVAGADRESLLGHVVFSLERTAVRDICVAGELVVRDGRHRFKEEIVREFGEVQRDLWK
ncbi:MAG: formimidoylglutamate deiminase [Bryobacteraceae bacterium]